MLLGFKLFLVSKVHRFRCADLGRNEYSRVKANKIDLQHSFESLEFTIFKSVSIMIQKAKNQ